MTQKSLIGITLFLIMLTNAGWATTQEPDIIKFKGQYENMRSWPFESYYSSPKQRPAFFKPQHTACWRGYVATWEVKNGYLFLLALRTSTIPGKGEEIQLSKIESHWKSRVKADWFTGIVKIPKGTGLHSARNESLYGQTLLLDIRKGKVVREGSITWQEYKPKTEPAVPVRHP